MKKTVVPFLCSLLPAVITAWKIYIMFGVTLALSGGFLKADNWYLNPYSYTEFSYAYLGKFWMGNLAAYVLMETASFRYFKLYKQRNRKAGWKAWLLQGTRYENKDAELC